MDNERTKKMNNKTTIILSALAAIATATLCAAPSSNTVEAVTQDWRLGNYSNVYELAQARFASNSNDLVAAHLVIAGKTLDYSCPGSTSFSLGGKLASYFSNSSGIRSVTK